jgi:hypothetical protein
LLVVLCSAKNIFSQPITSILQYTSYGVPTSPAFELLPGNVSQVVHLVTPHDVQTNLLSLYNSGHLSTGAAFDYRPFAGFARSLKAYQKDPLEQVAWRSVTSLGTAPASDNPADALIALGLRIPILDFGDPRASADYVTKIENTFNKYLHDHPLTGDASDEERMARLKAASDTSQAARTDFVNNSWNAVKLEVGIGFVARAVGGSFTKLLSDRTGFWAAFGFPIANFGQISASGKFTTWIRTDSLTQEASCAIIGASARIFPAGWFSATLEGSRSLAHYGIDSLNENWWHFAIVAEIKVPILSGWIGLGYGADSPHRSLVTKGVSFNYSYYQDAALKK